MKKSWLSICAATTVLAVLFFIMGYLAYPWAVEYIISGNTSGFIAINTEVTFTYPLLVASSVALSGIVIGVVAMLYHRREGVKSSMWVFVSLIPVAMVAIGGWLPVLKNRVTFISTEMDPILDGFDMTMPLGSLRLYEVGLFASACVMVCAVVVLEMQQRRLRRVKTAAAQQAENLVAEPISS